MYLFPRSIVVALTIAWGLVSFRYGSVAYTTLTSGNWQQALLPVAILVVMSAVWLRVVSDSIGKQELINLRNELADRLDDLPINCALFSRTTNAEMVVSNLIIGGRGVVHMDSSDRLQAEATAEQEGWAIMGTTVYQLFTPTKRVLIWHSAIRITSAGDGAFDQEPIPPALGSRLRRSLQLVGSILRPGSPMNDLLFADADDLRAVLHDLQDVEE